MIKFIELLQIRHFNFSLTFHRLLSLNHTIPVPLISLSGTMARTSLFSLDTY